MRSGRHVPSPLSWLIPRSVRADATRQNVLAPVLLKFPVAVVEWAHLARLEPARNAVKVECMVADAPCYRALLRCGGCLVGLAFYAQVHDVVAADGAVVHHDVWRGQYGVRKTRAGHTGVSDRHYHSEFGQKGRRARRAAEFGTRHDHVPHAQRATAFHFFTSKRGCSDVVAAAAGAAAAAAAASTSAVSPLLLSEAITSSGAVRARAEFERRRGGSLSFDRA